MNSTALAVRDRSAIAEQVVVAGDLSLLTPAERMTYYGEVCESIGLNPLTRPFDYLKLNGKLVLYAKREAADQLRTLHGVNIVQLDRQRDGDLYVVTAFARDKTGREDADMGIVTIKGLQGDALANAMMKAVTKAKRRVTLAICGLGWLDETEIETIPNAQPVTVTDSCEIVESAAAPVQEPQRDPFSVTRWLDWVNGGPKDGKMAEPAATDAYEAWCLDWDHVIDRSGAATSVVNWITNSAGWRTLTAYQLKALQLTLTSERFTQADRDEIQKAAQVYAEQAKAAMTPLEAFKAELEEVPF